ncbi:MAG: hypothetical protein ONB32_16450 [candidate division KSB1 bacterium]|nr:hypothetical protein [candidate division KSB1 bacterium]
MKKELLVVDNEPSIRQFVQKSFHLDNYCFDSGTEKNFFLDLLKREGANIFYFTVMLTHGESEFFISYIDPISHTVRKYFPDLGGEIKNKSLC